MLASAVEATQSTAPAQHCFSSGFAGSASFFAFDDLARAQACEIIGLLRAPGRRRDLKATVAKNCSRDRADAPGGAGDHHGPLLGAKPWRSSAMTASMAL
jgi:hypothetical protein